MNPSVKGDRSVARKIFLNPNERRLQRQFFRLEADLIATHSRRQRAKKKTCSLVLLLAAKLNMNGREQMCPDETESISARLQHSSGLFATSLCAGLAR